VHHHPDGTPSRDPGALAKVVALAAEDTGIRLLVLPVAYARGGLPRFRDPSAQAFLQRVDDLREWSEGRPLVEVSVGTHSVKAVPRGWLEEIGRSALRDDLPVHIHADEQKREIEECKAEHGMRPIELPAYAGFLGPGTTVVYATQANERELDLLSNHGASVGACPTTEGNLGDGFLPAEEILERNLRLSVGSDSHVRIDPFEELRELETNARRLSGRRNVLLAQDATSPTPWLLRACWHRAGLNVGDPADLTEIDLSHPALADVEARNLPSALVFGGGVGSSQGRGSRASASPTPGEDALISDLSSTDVPLKGPGRRHDERSDKKKPTAKFKLPPCSEVENAQIQPREAYQLPREVAHR
jgi:formimidoylglutamate deiminase